MRMTRFVLAMIAIGVSGCTTQKIGSFTLLSTKNLGRQIVIPDVTQQAVVEGVSQLSTYFVVPVGSKPTIDSAVTDALEKGAGNVLVDVELSTFVNMYFPFIYMEQGFKVRGKVVNVSVSP